AAVQEAEDLADAVAIKVPTLRHSLAAVDAADAVAVMQDVAVEAGVGGLPSGAGGEGLGAPPPPGTTPVHLAARPFRLRPYSLTGQPVTKPLYSQTRFSASLGGPLVIPKIVKSTSSNYTITYNGTRNSNPFDVFSTVPTLAERSGDFSQSTIRNGVNAGNPVQIFDPVSHASIANNVLPQSMIDAPALAFLQFIPKPTLPGTGRSF